MGLSIHDIGRGLRWSDVGTIIRHLPPDSHLRAQQNPETLQVRRYQAPVTEVLSLAVDELVGLRFQLAGQGENAPPPLLDRLLGADSSEEKEEPRRPPQASPSELRQRVAASMT